MCFVHTNIWSASVPPSEGARCSSKRSTVCPNNLSTRSTTMLALLWTRTRPDTIKPARTRVCAASWIHAVNGMGVAVPDQVGVTLPSHLRTHVHTLIPDGQWRRLRQQAADIKNRQV
jgi:hypothetical protein